MYKEKTVSVIIPAAGVGRRMGSDKKKQFLEINGIPVLIRTLKKFDSSEIADEIIVVTGKDDIDSVKSLISEHGIKKVKTVTAGGDERQASVYNGVCASCGDIVMIHDGVRPFVCREEIESAAEGAYTYGAAAAGVPLADTIKLSDDEGFSLKTLSRENVVRILTPQALDRNIYSEAYHNATENKLLTTDDISLAELMGIKPKITFGSIKNIKITRPEDLEIAELFVKGEE